MRWTALLLTLASLGAYGALNAASANEPQPFDRGSWAKLRAAHAGQAIVVHFWGLTCGPCLVEMPRWGRLLAERKDLRLVLIAADPAPQPPEKVEARLTSDGLDRVESWNFADRFVERLFYEVDPAWQGELPRTLLIAADGTPTVLVGVADLNTVRAWLDRQALSPASTER